MEFVLSSNVGFYGSRINLASALDHGGDDDFLMVLTSLDLDNNGQLAVHLSGILYNEV